MTLASERIYYRRGTGTGPPHLLLIHGSGGDHSHWPEPLLWSSCGGVLAVDLPGHGRSGVHGRRHVTDYAGRIDRFIDALGLSDVVLAGHSLGGAIAMEVALTRPAWLTRLVLVGTGARLRVAPQILDRLRSDFPAAVDRIAEWAFGPSPPVDARALLTAVMRATGPEVTHGDFAACDRFDIMDRLDAIDLPTLVMAADADRLTPVRYSEFLRDRIAGSRLAVLPGVGHMMMLESAERFTRIVEAFMTGKDARQ